MTPLRLHLTWLIHALGRTRNPLRRTLDRITAAVTASVIALGIAVPFLAILLGVRSYGQESQQAARFAADSRPVAATLVTDTPPAAIPWDGTEQLPPTPAVAQWPTPGGLRTATIDVPASSTPGTPVTVWLDHLGNVTHAPASASAILCQSVALALGITLVAIVCCAALIVIVHRIAYHYASRRWEREWNALQGGSWRLRPR